MIDGWRAGKKAARGRGRAIEEERLRLVEEESGRERGWVVLLLLLFFGVKTKGKLIARSIVMS